MEIAGAVVQALTEHVINVVEKQVNYASEFRTQLTRLKDVLEKVNNLLQHKIILNVQRKPFKSSMVQLRQLIYEADDIITDCIVRDLYIGWRRRVDFCFRNSTGKKLIGINSRLDEKLNSLRESLNLTESQSSDKDSVKLPSQDFTPNVVIGLDEDITKIIGFICKPGKFRRVGIWGMGGLGKTTLVQEIYNDERVSSFFDARIWVSVSKSFNERRILTTVLNKLGGVTPMDESSLMREIRAAATRRKKGCLVVMDDVWSIDDMARWNELFTALKVKGQASCFLVTTRFRGLAENVASVDESMVHEARKLDEIQSWKLFCQFASPAEEFKDEAKKIVKKCDGLPLSIKTIASLLAGKERLRDWTDVVDRFHGNSIIKGNEQVIENLRLSYNELKPHLQQCLLCFSVYPEDSDISTDQVIHWWLAEGLLEKRDSVRSKLELGHDYLSALINSCLVEVGERREYDHKVYTCKIHDMVRELIMTIAKEEGFCSFNEKGIPIRNEDSYWLCLHANVLGEKDSEEPLSFGKQSKLRAVLLMPDHHISINKNSGVLSSLRMLDLSGGSGSCNNLDSKSLQSLLDWIAELKRLAGLNLSGFQNLEELPSSICKLKNLQLLVLSRCSNLKRLDASIAKLKKLVVLDLESCPKLEYLPLEFENLHTLQELKGFTVTIGGPKSKASCGIPQLAKLTELRVLYIVVCSDDMADLSEARYEWSRVLSGLKELTTLGIDAGKMRNGAHMLESLCPPKKLKELYLWNCRWNKLPAWICPETLEDLEYLGIEEMENVTEWKCEKGKKWKALKGLRLKGMPKLGADWAQLKELIPALTYLEVIRCDGLINLPEMKNGIWRLTLQRT